MKKNNTNFVDISTILSNSTSLSERPSYGKQIEIKSFRCTKTQEELIKKFFNYPQLTLNYILQFLFEIPNLTNLQSESFDLGRKKVLVIFPKEVTLQ